MKFGIYLKKSHFALEESKHLGHIISKDGINIDPSRLEAIEQIAIPRSKKKVQSFIGKVNFLRRSILNCAEIMRSITDMLRKENDINWTQRQDGLFERLKLH